MTQEEAKKLKVGDCVIDIKYKRMAKILEITPTGCRAEVVACSGVISIYKASYLTKDFTYWKPLNENIYNKALKIVEVSESTLNALFENENNR